MAPSPRSLSPPLRLLCAAAVLLACRTQGVEGVSIELRADQSLIRPDHLLIWWQAPGAAHRKEIRMPEAGALPASGPLGTLVMELDGAAAGERKVVVWGMRGEGRVSGAVAFVPWAPGDFTTIALTLGCLEDLDRMRLLPADPPGSPPATACPGSRPGPDGEPPVPPAPDAMSMSMSMSGGDAGPAPDGSPPQGSAGDAGAADAPAGDATAPADGPAPEAPHRDGGPPPGPDAGPDVEVRRDAPALEALPPGVDLERGIVLYFRFDDPPGTSLVRDSSGSRNRAVVKQLDPVRSWVDGYSGGSLDFAGAGWVAVDSSPSLNSIAEGFTISAFLDRNGDGTVAARRSVGASGFLYRLQVAGGKLAVAINSSAGARADLTAGEVLAAGQWVHVAAVYDRQTVRLYAGGSKIAQQVYQQGIGPEESPLLVGASQDATPTGATLPFAGRMDEVALYNRALSDGEVAALAAGFAPAAR